MGRKKLIASLAAIVLVICTSFVSISVYKIVEKKKSACEIESNVNPVEILTNYLEAIKSHEVDKAVSILREAGSTETQQKEFLNESLEDPSFQIVEIQDVTLEYETYDIASLSITVEYKDGRIVQSPACLKKDNGEYKLIRITAKEKVIKQATETDVDSTSN